MLSALRRSIRRDRVDLGLRKLIGPLVKGQRRRLVIVSVMSVVVGLADAGILLIIARVAFSLTSGDDRVSLSLPLIGKHSVSLDNLIVLAGALVIVRSILQWFTARTSAKIIADVMLRERRSLVALLLDASWEVQSGLRSGRAQELVSGYVVGAASALASLVALLTSSFNLGAMLLAAFVVSPYASAGAAVAALVIALMLRPLRRGVRSAVAARAEGNLALATHITEMTATLQEVRIFGVSDVVENQVAQDARNVSELERRAQVRTALIPTVYQGTMMLIIVVALGIVYGAGVTGLASLGGVVLIMIRGLTSAQGVQSAIQGMHGAAPYAEVLENEKAELARSVPPLGGAPLPDLRTIEFERVSFAYRPDSPVLREVSFVTREREIIGIIGPSGAGKSTLVQLLLRLRNPSSGRILANGLPTTELSARDWYDRMTFVPQDPHLFAGSVYENIRFFRPAVDRAAIERAAKLAHIHDDIMAWPAQYETPVGERGGQLSGGQQQRLCIARALIGEPDVVVLDEPTSALDVKSEALMRDTLEELAVTKTVFVVAHRLSTLSICTRIMVLLDGRIQGFDAPERLERDNPFYREALQLSGLR